MDERSYVSLPSFNLFGRTGTTIAGGNLCFFQAFLGMSMLTIIASCVSGYMALIDLEKIFPSLLNSTWGGTKV